MINLLSNNGTSDSKIPCPFCRMMAEVCSMVEEFSSSPISENPIPAIDLMASEIRMWRSKDSYERKLKANLIEGISVKIKKAEGL